MGYQVKNKSSAIWEVFDSENQNVFEGSLRECEAWIDQQETKSQKTWLRSVMDWMKKSKESESAEFAPPLHEKTVSL